MACEKDRPAVTAGVGVTERGNVWRGVRAWGDTTTDTDEAAVNAQ